MSLLTEGFKSPNEKMTSFFEFSPFSAVNLHVQQLSTAILTMRRLIFLLGTLFTVGCSTGGHYNHPETHEPVYEQQGTQDAVYEDEVEYVVVEKPIHNRSAVVIVYDHAYCDEP